MMRALYGVRLLSLLIVESEGGVAEKRVDGTI